MTKDERGLGVTPADKPATQKHINKTKGETYTLLRNNKSGVSILE